MARADDLLRGERAGHFRLKYAQLLLGDIGEGAFRHAKALGENFCWDVGEKVGNQEDLVLIEVAIIEDEQELRSVGADSLKGVGYADREVPDVLLAKSS